MADPVTALTHWRLRAREVVRAEHTREIRETLPETAKAVLIKLASELDAANARIARLERALERLAKEATQEVEP